MCQGKRHDVFWLFGKISSGEGAIIYKGKPSAYGEEQITLPNEAETFQEIPGFTMEIPGISRISPRNSWEFKNFPQFPWVFKDFCRNSENFKDFPWKFLGFQGFSMEIPGNSRFFSGNSLEFKDFPWKFLGIQGFSMEIPGNSRFFSRNSLEFKDFPRKSWVSLAFSASFAEGIKQQSCVPRQPVGRVLSYLPRRNHREHEPGGCH